MNEKDLRDCFAMFAMMGIISGRETNNMEVVAGLSYAQADAMLEARNKEPEQEVGIVAAKTRRKK
jgi:hypothetical protein